MMLKKALVGLSAGMMLLGSSAAMADTYKIDKEGAARLCSSVFSTLGYSWLYGTFKDFDGTFTFDKADPQRDNVDVTIKTGSRIPTMLSVTNICAEGIF